MKKDTPQIEKKSDQHQRDRDKDRRSEQYHEEHPKAEPQKVKPTPSKEE